MARNNNGPILCRRAVWPCLIHQQRLARLNFNSDPSRPTQALGNDVGNRLALACSRRPVENKTGSRIDRENCFELAGIARQDGKQLRGMDLRVESRGRWNRHGERRWSRIITRNPANTNREARALYDLNGNQQDEVFFVYKLEL